MMNLCRILFLKLLNIFQKRMKGTHGNDASVFESIMKLKGEMIWNEETKERNGKHCIIFQWIKCYNSDESNL